MVELLKVVLSPNSHIEETLFCSRTDAYIVIVVEEN
jgi:hypothetical protein